MRQVGQKITRLVYVGAGVLFLAATLASYTTPVLALSANQAITENRIFFFDESGTAIEECTPTNSPAGNVDRFLQALAKQESDGDPKAQNPGSSASGKYQYITSTWRSRVADPDGNGPGTAMYPPGEPYAVAKDASEAIQDAVAYIEYSKKFSELNNDLFKLAVNHFYPAAISNPALLDKIIGSNTITPREYAESVVKKVKEGYGSDIQLLYREAPEFNRYSQGAAATDTTSVSGKCSEFFGGDLSQTTLAYAWPEYHEPNYLKKMPAYADAVKRAQREGRYVGGGTNPGIDCGGFVTLLLTDSGFEPKYNHSGRGGNTPVQEAWAQANWRSLGSGSDIDTASLQPGDVAFSPGHTFVFVGTIEGFDSNIASASYSSRNTSWRAPMAGGESLTSGDVRWYRKS